MNLEHAEASQMRRYLAQDWQDKLLVYIGTIDNNSQCLICDFIQTFLKSIRDQDRNEIKHQED